MTIGTRILRTAAREVAARARGEAARRLMEIGEELLLEAGRVVEERRRRRVRHRALARAATVVAVAGAGAAAVLATRAAVRRRRAG
jgi:hypothetical protein